MGMQFDNFSARSVNCERDLHPLAEKLRTIFVLATPKVLIVGTPKKSGLYAKPFYTKS